MIANILTFPDTFFCSITMLYHLFNSKGHVTRTSPSLTRLANLRDLVLFLTLMLGILYPVTEFSLKARILAYSAWTCELTIRSKLTRNSGPQLVIVSICFF